MGLWSSSRTLCQALASIAIPGVPLEQEVALRQFCYWGQEVSILGYPGALLPLLDQENHSLHPYSCFCLHLPSEDRRLSGRLLS